MFSDLKYAIRSLSKAPAFTVIAVFTLALGIGANAAMFSLIKFVLLSPYPYPEPQRLMVLWEQAPKFEHASIAWPDLLDWQRDNRAFAAIGGFRGHSYTFTGNGVPEMLRGGNVNAALFDAVQLSPALGRVFTGKEDRPGAPALVLLSHEFWQRRFAGNPQVLGQSLRLNGAVHEVIGVMPPQFSLLVGADVFTPLGRMGDTPSWQSRGNHPGINAIGRLKPGFTPAQGLADLERISARIRQESAAIEPGLMTAAGKPLLDVVVGPYRQGLWMLLGAVGLVLLIACVNVANLLLARGVEQRADMAVRAALGASRARLLRASLAESVLLVLAGGVVGVLLAYAVRGGLAALSPVGGIALGYLPVKPLFQRAHLDGSVLLITFIFSLLTVAAFGLWPAVKATRPDFLLALKSGGRSGSTDGDTKRSRGVLVVAEVALTLMLLAGAGLLFKSLLRIQTADLGFSPHNVLTARMSLSEDGYATDDRAKVFVDRLMERLRALPGVRSAEIAYGSPLMPGYQTGYSIDANPRPDGTFSIAEMNRVSDGYFETLKIPLLRGRPFGPQDAATRDAVVILDRTFADKRWPGADPLGKQIYFGDSVPATVVGVVPTLRLYGYAVDPQLMQGYFSLRQKAQTSRTYVLLVRADANAEVLKDTIQRAVLAVNPGQPLWDIRTLDDRVGESFGTARLYAFLLMIFAGLALLLAVIGLYGVLAFQVASRTREFGIRMALGSRQSQVMSLILRQGLSLVAAGLLVGMGGALLLGRLLNSLLYRTSAYDPAVFAGVAALLSGITVVACWLPARRATKVDPLVALRSE